MDWQIINAIANLENLIEINLSNTYGTQDTIHIGYLMQNISPKLEKMNLSQVQGIRSNIQDDHIEKLVKRCMKITHLNLSYTGVTNRSLDSIIGNLPELIDLEIQHTAIDLKKISQLKSLKKLKFLNGCQSIGTFFNYLDQFLPILTP